MSDSNFKDKSRKAEYKVAIVSLIALSFCVFLGKSYENTLRGIDSNIHSSISMSVTSQQFLPKLPPPDPNPRQRIHGKNDQRIFNDHPFFFFWLNGKLMRALYPSAWSARILTATFSTGCIILTLILGADLVSPLFGFISALFLLFSRDIILTGASVSLDPPLLFFILLSFIFWLREKWIWMGVSAGVGLWFKTPVVLLVYPTAFFISCFHKKIKSQFRKLLISFLIAACLGSAIWILTGILGGWNLVSDYWIRQFWGTAIGGRSQPQRISLDGFYRIVFRGFVPGFPFLFIAFIKIFQKQLWKNVAFQVSVIAITIVVLFITSLRFRLDHYYNPIFPFLSLIATYALVDWVKKYERQFLLGFIAFVPIFLSYLLCTPTQLGPEAFVALKRFIPYIQSTGNCDDEIMLIPGGEPIGSSNDYGLALKFYTNRQVFISSCESANQEIQTSAPSWIILSEDRLNHCLSSNNSALYPFQIQMKHQLLLSRIITPSPRINLTPLENELKPVIDCRNQGYPNG